MFMHVPGRAELIKVEPSPRQLLWLDIEMTGPDDSTHDKLLHIVGVAGDFGFTEDAVYEGVAYYKWEDIQPLIKGNSEFWNRHPDLEERYKSLAETGIPIETIDAQLAEFIDIHFTEPAILAGNSVFEDRKWIKRHLPSVESLLDRRIVDVSTLKLCARGLWGVKFPKVESHDPLDDIRESRQELVALLRFLRCSPKDPLSFLPFQE